MATKSMLGQMAVAGRREERRGEPSPKRSLSHSRVDENLRGLLILIAASAALVAIAYGAMMALTSPGGWATKVAGDAMAGETAVLTSFVEPGSTD
jgi:hypothetical protein